MDPDRSLSTEVNHDQSLRSERTKVVRGHTEAQGKSHILGVSAVGRHRLLGSETSSSESSPLIGRGTAAILTLTTILTAVLSSIAGQ